VDFEFVEVDIFSKQLLSILTDEEYVELQAYLISRPMAGSLIPGGKGIRKLRWGFSDKGKSGGVRVIYYVYLKNYRIYMINIYKKTTQADLSKHKLASLAFYVDKYLKG